MQLSTKARYSVRAMIELAARYGQGPTLLKDIARRQGISEKYLEQLMAPLRASGLIFTIRGNRGGYVLGRDPSQITLYEIINIVEGSLAPVPCVDKEQICDRTAYCVTRDIWSRLKENIIKELEGVTLQELASRQEHKHREAGLA